MIGMLKRFEIQILRRAGHTLAETAALAGVSQRTVQSVETEPAVEKVDTASERVRREIGRPSKVEPFRDFLAKTLEEEPELLSVELFRRARLEGYDGGKSALYELVRALRPVSQRPLVRFEGLPGEFTQHDFGQVSVRYLNGTRQRVHFFASRLKYSRWVEVSLVENEQVESLARTLVEHFDEMGGVPLLAVFDRPKTVALSWAKNGEVLEWNSTFAGVALDLGLGIELCWPASPQQKGSVENLVGWVKGSFFKQRRFVDEEDLRVQLAQWHEEVNSQRPSRATGVIPAERLKEERPRLRPLKVRPDQLALRIPVVVSPMAMVLHDTHLYSMPPDSIGVSGTLYLYRDQVRIVAGRFEALHKRVFAPGERSTLPEHRAQAVAAVSGKRGKRYMQREHLLELGPPALEFLTELTHRRPRAWMRDVEKLHDMLQRYGKEALRSAFELGLTEQTFGFEYIAHYLKSELESMPRPSNRQQELPL
jgi:transposase